MIKQLIQKKLAWGVIVITVTQILGMLPALDFLPPIYLKLVSFGLGISLTIAKGVEMYYDQTAQLESKTQIDTQTTTPDGAQISQRSVIETKTPVDPAPPK